MMIGIEGGNIIAFITRMPGLDVAGLLLPCYEPIQ